MSHKPWWLSVKEFFGLEVQDSFGWNYRIMKRKYPDSDETYYSFVEAYYEDNHEVSSWTVRDIPPHAEDYTALVGMVFKACAAEVLDEEEIERKQALRKQRKVFLKTSIAAITVINTVLSTIVWLSTQNGLKKKR